MINSFLRRLYMLSSYNLSTRLKDYLNSIENKRREILLTPIPPKKQLQLRWQAMNDTIYYSLRLSGNTLTKSEVIKLLTTQKEKNLKKQEQEVIKYKSALDYIKQHWLVSPAPVTPNTVLNLYEIACSGRLKVAVSELKHLLDYLQTHLPSPVAQALGGRAEKENPIVQAGVANIEIMKMRPFTDGNRRLGRLLSHLFLYKYGYDFDGLLVFEKSWAENPELFLQNYQIALHATSITLWLEFFAKSIETALSEVLKNFSFPQELPAGLPPSFWTLNDRQKSILSRLEEPGSSITNKKVQKRFKVSQITASRDLTKLKILGLVNSYGKGRSVYYTI